MSEVKLYAERDLMGLDRAGNHYCKHILAMTKEGLHAKSDIAAELAFRDFELAALREELAVAKHDIASFLETTAKVCDLLGIDTEDEKHAEGNPSDVFFSHATALSKRLAAAEQRNATLLETARGLTIQLHATIGNTEHHEDCIRDLAALAQPTESGASEEDEQDAKTVFIRSNIKQGQNISMADMKARYEDKP